MGESLDVSRLLRGTLLDGRDVLERPLSATTVALVVELAPAEVELAWRLARGLVERTGRWPVVVGSPDDWVDHVPDDLGWDMTPEAVCERAAQLTIADVMAKDLQNSADTRAAGWTSQVGWHLTMTRRWSGTLPSDAEAMQAVAVGDELGLERWLLDYELRHEPAVRPDRRRHMDWWPMAQERCFLVLPPTARSAATLAYISWFGFEQTSRELVVCALQSWSDRFGAELVACWGTVLDFVVTRPPATLDEAFVLATEHAAIAPATLWSSGLTIRAHARELVGRTTWRLHEGP